MDASPLARLPVELRVCIYEYTFFRDDHLVLDMSHGSSIKAKSFTSHIFALTVTCRELRAEALPVFYANTRFSITLTPFLRFQHNSESDPYDALMDAILYCQLQRELLNGWFHSVRPKNARLIPEIQFELGTWYLNSSEQNICASMSATTVALWRHLFDRKGATFIANLRVSNSRTEAESLSVSLPICSQKAARTVIDELFKARSKQYWPGGPVGFGGGGRSLDVSLRYWVEDFVDDMRPDAKLELPSDIQERLEQRNLEEQ